MKYQINTTNYCDFSIYEINKLAPRSYFIPYPNREAADAVSQLEKRYHSAKVKCLNGTWDFHFYKNPNELPQEFDTETIKFDRITVPGCWQFQGYDRPFYVNARYQFPLNPPHIPTTKPVGRVFSWMGADIGIGRPHWVKPEGEYNYVGVYRTKFEIKDIAKTIAKRYTIAFLGVAGCLDLYVNGSFVGYSEGSHNTAEFDLTDFLREGENELVAVVHRWCTGTYLECQDMFRNNGIFRDVLLYISEPMDVWDYSFDTRWTGDGGYTATVSVSTYSATEVKVTLRGENIDTSVIKTMTQKEGKKRVIVVKDAQPKPTITLTFHNLKPLEWNAEQPTLYDLYIETPHGCIKSRVGFKRVDIAGTVFQLNGKKIKLFGVNHHDTSAETGYTMSPELILKDILLCKEFNIDTLRTSHYPPDPLLLELCDEYGIYVVDEADIETHGGYNQKFPPDIGFLSRKTAWKAHYMDRGKRMYQRDKLHPSIIMWSMGNEAGGQLCQDAMADYFKSVSALPVHYEGVSNTKRKAYDVGSGMYPSVARIRSIGHRECQVKELNDRPYFMCEYAHAMGVGPGGIEDYWQEIFAYDNLMGGCIWEMVDHAVRGKSGFYTYGGDHGEWEHDSNFCVDGLFYPDRMPSTGARLARFTYRPLRVSHVTGDRYRIFNTRAFSDGDRYRLRFIWSDGSSTEVCPKVAPLNTAELEIVPERTPETAPVGDWFVKVICSDKITGRQVSEEQIILREAFAAKPAQKIDFPRDFKLNEDGTFNWKVGDGFLTTGRPYTVLFRAKTDNDGGFFPAFKMESFYAAEEKLLSIRREDYRIVVTGEITGKKFAFTYTDTYESTEQGIVLTARLHCTKGKGKLPRFGKAFRLAESYQQIRYYGRNGESYKDMVDHTQIEEVNCRVTDMTEPNLRPQESGNRMDTRYVVVGNGKSAVKFTAIGRAFELGVKPYSDRELTEMKHREDEKCTGTYLTVSAFMMGIGTGSCGPATEEKYCYPMNRDYEMSILITDYPPPGQDA